MNKLIATTALGVLTAGAFVLSVVPKAIAYQSTAPTPVDSTQTLTQDSQNTLSQGSPRLQEAEETLVAGTYVC